LPNKAEAKYAIVNGLQMYYEIHGTGEPLVLLHGAFGWANVYPALAKNRQQIALELQGHGHTADIDRPLTPEQMAEDLAALRSASACSARASRTPCQVVTDPATHSWSRATKTSPKPPLARGRNPPLTWWRKRLLDRGVPAGGPYREPRLKRTGRWMRRHRFRTGLG
jgi:hypothetical protein